MNTRYIHTFIRSGLYVSLLEMARLFKVNFIVGSSCAFFSGAQCVSPLFGAWGGFGGTALFWLWSMLRSGIFGGFPLTLTAYHISMTCASAYWATRSWIVRLGIPMLCIILFLAHPVGREAFFYSFYWFIPLVLYWRKEQTIFTTALGSTFTAHAVGSVLWLYSGSYTSAMFAALMPVVIVERLLFATGMVLVYQGVDFVQKKYSSFNLTTSSSTAITEH